MGLPSMSTAIDTLLRPASTRVGTALACLVLVTSCASYRTKTEAALSAFEGGYFEKAQTLYADQETTGSRFLSGAEAGSAAFAAGDWEGSLAHLGDAAQKAREVEDSAIASPENLGESLVSFAISESLSDYVGEGYERVLLHAQLAMSYLALGQFDSARVEVRRANQLLESEQELYEKEYQAGGLGHFLSALVYELEGSPDDAYIDFKRMESKGIGGELVGRSLVRLGNVLHRSDELPVWEERYGADTDRPEGYAEVVVIASVGLGPFKEAVTLPIPTGDGIVQWSVPRYRIREGQERQVQLIHDASGNAVSSSVIENVATVAHENLEDRIAWLAARSAIRGLLKQQLTKHLEDQWGDGLGLLVGNLFAVATERADLRCWLTLPHTFQAARAFLAPGVHDLTLRVTGGDSVSLGTIELVPGETMFVFARTLGSRVYAHPIGGKLIEPEEPETPQVGELPDPAEPTASAADQNE